MTDTAAAAFQREGAHPFATEGTEEETSADSQSENDDQGGDTQSDDGDNNNRTEENIPFHEHPRWKQREDEWTERFNSQETRHQADLAAIRQEFGQARKENAENTKIPAWFGGSQEQWDAYRADRDAELKAAEDRAEARAIERLKGERKSEDDAVKEATDYMKTELAAIQADKTLNPTGAPIDPQALLKVVLENELIDSKGRWNYRAGFKLMQGSTTVKKTVSTTEKKKVAAETTSENRAETKPKDYKTSEDFKKKRPW